MNKVVHLMSGEARNVVEIVVLVKQYLEQEQRNQVVSALKMTGGIIEAVFCSVRNNLVLTT